MPRNVVGKFINFCQFCGKLLGNNICLHFSVIHMERSLVHLSDEFQPKFSINPFDRTRTKLIDWIDTVRLHSFFSCICDRIQIVICLWLDLSKGRFSLVQPVWGYRAALWYKCDKSHDTIMLPNLLLEEDWWISLEQLTLQYSSVE